ncbi:hypothetical protein DSO57_1025747 [Entomophthora muscae]|uniref:Uncharacterized protein n=1 Tax=Entomophthora muscae TaxID=34485 RepID=A0ACC2RGY9_9FUNG|nr:hypothetical protein DSO57_1025747 [Entomophthora muscae]
MKLELLLTVGLGSSLTILHTNDVHSHYDPTNELGMDCSEAQVKAGQCYGGMARLKGQIDRIRANRSDVLLLDAGDQFQGSMYYTYYKGNASWEFMNLLKYDAMTLGNHEFDDGVENLARVIANFNFPVVCANVVGLEDSVVPYTKFPQHDLAVVGYITESTGRLSKTGSAVNFLDPAPVVQGVVDKLRSEGVSNVIALSHNGYFEDKQLASTTRGIGLIIDGHSHSYLSSASAKPPSLGKYPTAVRNLDGETVYIIQAYCWGRFLGHVDVTFRPDGYLQSIEGAPIELTTDLPQDPKALQLMASLSKPFDSFRKKKVGYASADFTEGHCQSEECAMGNLMADALLYKRIPFGGQIALMNSGGIRATFSKGPITAQQVLAVLPFDNQVTQFPMTGQEIWDMFASAIERKSRSNGLPIISFVQVAGIRYSYDPKSLKLLSIHVFKSKYHPIVRTETYQVVAADFLATGGDNLIVPPRLNLTGHGIQSQVLMEYLSSHNPITPTLDSRITLASHTLRLSPTNNLLHLATNPSWRPVPILSCLFLRCHV